MKWIKIALEYCNLALILTIDINKFFTLALLNECDSNLLAISTQHLGSQKNFVPAPRSSIFQFQLFFSLIRLGEMRVRHAYSQIARVVRLSGNSKASTSRFAQDLPMMCP